ncbi:MAG: molecular chaperone DnaK, partial [Candidatus Thermofonsia Clade 1 bacterium]
EAERNRAADERRKQEIELNNLADSTVYAAEKALRDYGAKIDSALKSSIEKQIEAVKKAREGRDQGQIRSAVEELQRSVQQIGASMYGQPNVGGTPNQEPDGRRKE